MSDIVELVRADHRELRRLIADLTDGSPERAHQLDQLAILLVTHTRAVEGTLHPAATNETAGPDGPTRRQGQHHQVEEILDRLARTDARDPAFDRDLSALAVAIDQHIAYEEDHALRDVQDELDTTRRRELADDFQLLRAQQAGELTRDYAEHDRYQRGHPSDSDGTS